MLGMEVSARCQTEDGPGRFCFRERLALVLVLVMAAEGLRQVPSCPEPISFMNWDKWGGPGSGVFKFLGCWARAGWRGQSEGQPLSLHTLWMPKPARPLSRPDLSA